MLVREIEKSNNVEPPSKEITKAKYPCILCSNVVDGLGVLFSEPKVGAVVIQDINKTFLVGFQSKDWGGEAMWDTANPVKELTITLD